MSSKVVSTFLSTLCGAYVGLSWTWNVSFSEAKGTVRMAITVIRSKSL